ncbi:unnamed protein product, partial [Lepeophtheirus salmonis]
MVAQLSPSAALEDESDEELIKEEPVKPPIQQRSDGDDIKDIAAANESCNIPEDQRGDFIKHYLNPKWDYCSDACFDCGISNDLGNSCQPQNEGSEGYYDNAVFPWHARIVNRQNAEVLCSGVILSNTRVLTTANCKGYYHRYGINVYAGAGTLYREDGYQDGMVSGFVAHVSYKMETGENNIAMIYLHYKLVWNDKVLPICFSNDYFPIRDGQLATFSGSNFLNVHTDSPYVHFSIVKKLNNNFYKDCQKNDLLCTKRNSV